MGSIEVADELSGVGGLIILPYLIDYKDDLQEAVKKRDFSSSLYLTGNYQVGKIDIFVEYYLNHEIFVWDYMFPWKMQFYSLHIKSKWVLEKQHYWSLAL